MGVSWGLGTTYINHWTGSIFCCIGHLQRKKKEHIRKEFSDHVMYVPVGIGANSPAVHRGKIHKPNIYPGASTSRALSISSGGRSAENHRHSFSTSTPPERSKLQLKTWLFSRQVPGKNPKRERYRSVEARPARGKRASGTRTRHQSMLVFGNG